MVRYKIGTVLADRSDVTPDSHLLIEGYEDEVVNRDEPGEDKLKGFYNVVVFFSERKDLYSRKRMATTIESWVGEGLMKEVPKYKAPRRLQMIIEELEYDTQ